MKLSDILSSGSGGGNIHDDWNAASPADDFGPLPPGEYIARIIAGILKQSRSNGTPGYGLTFEVLEPSEYAQRKFWHDCWLTPAAMPQSKRDLGKLGVTSLEQLERPLPKYIRCKCKLALRKDDNGNESNRLKSFEVIGIDTPEPDPFAPTESEIDSDGEESEPKPATDPEPNDDNGPSPF